MVVAALCSEAAEPSWIEFARKEMMATDIIPSRSSRSMSVGIENEAQVIIPEVGSRLGRCVLHTFMAAGRNSIVFLGSLAGLDLPVAVKILAPRRQEDRPYLLDHLRNEFRLLSRLNHPNIARLWDYQDDEECSYLATEYVESLTLTQLMVSHGGKLHPKLATRIVIKVLDALQTAWRLGYIHRDIKPDNVLFTPDGEVKVIDWGLAGEIGQNARRSSSVVGSPAYMAPETVYLDDTFDHRSDIYSLGATLYQLVTGQVPFDCHTPARMLEAHRLLLPTPLSRIVGAPGIERLSLIVQRMLAKSAADRYSIAHELRNDLANYDC
jgi:serine/threonine protein kinase